MPERNLIKEGFVFNTRAPGGTISGSQIVGPGEINALVDQDLTTTALTISGGESIVLDADLGARWKLDRIELYTDEASSANFTIEISDNNLDFNPVAMTGSAGLWVGDLSPTVASGSPRYLRYNHAPGSATLVREWTAINDETFLDFGADGLQTSLTVDDAPIGQPSDFVETLQVKNNFSNPAEGFVFIDKTGTAADDEIEISASASGPWLGRNTSNSNQPSQVRWEEGSFSNTRVLPSGTIIFEFTDGDDKDWEMSGATLSLVDGALQGSTTAASPLVFRSSEFLDFASEDTFINAKNKHENKFSFRASDVDTVKVRARVQTPISTGNLVEGPRLFWKTEQDVEASPSTFRSELSVQSIVGDSPFTGQVQEFVFPVSTATTWSGTIRGFGFQPFTVSTGTGLVFDFLDLEALHSEGDQVVLALNEVPSGTFALPFDVDNASFDDSNIVFSKRHQVTQDCIITKVGAVMPLSTSNAIFLARELDTSNFPVTGTNFTVPYAIEVDSSTTVTAGNLVEFPVFWTAQEGDVICAATNANLADQFAYQTGDAGDAFVATTFSGSGALSLSTLANIMNSNAFAEVDRNYFIFYEAVSPEEVGYKSSGTYRTPVFDIGASPTLAQLDFDFSAPGGTSVDTLGQSGFDSVRARASDLPPRRGLALGETGLVSGTNNRTIGGFVNESAVVTNTAANPLQINTENDLIPSAGVNLLNVGGAILYHQNLDELWVLNNVISGTNPLVLTDLRPAWDVLSSEDGSYIRTDHVKGSLTYGYDSGLIDEETFSPIGFVADYELDEIYIMQKQRGFGVGAGQYFGIVLDTQGNFKDVIFRSTAMGLPLSNQTDENFFAGARGMAYAPDLRDETVNDQSIKGVFFVIHEENETNAAFTDLAGMKISAFRNGDDAGVRNTGLINTKSFSAIAGLGFVSQTNRNVKGVVYNPTDSRLYLLFDNLSGTEGAANRRPEILALDVSFNDTTSQFDYSLATISGTAFDTAPDVSGFSKEASFDSANQDNAIIDRRSHDFTMGATYVNKRDTFAILRSYRGKRPFTFPDVSAIADSVFANKSLSFIFECGAGTQSFIELPSFPTQKDALWGSVSGTLGFEDLATEGLNFPVGRFAQIEYQLNSDAGQTETPSLVNSNLGQGLRLGTIPPSGTKDLFVRTNIPDGQAVGDQQGRLKLYWESIED